MNVCSSLSIQASLFSHYSIITGQLYKGQRSKSFLLALVKSLGYVFKDPLQTSFVYKYSNLNNDEKMATTPSPSLKTSEYIITCK